MATIVDIAAAYKPIIFTKAMQTIKLIMAAINEVCETFLVSFNPI